MRTDRKKGLVSVIVPNLNYARFLPACIDSVIAQTYTNWELIIVDDNSTDNSCEIVQDYIDKYPDLDITLLQNNKGPSGTPTPINMGIRAMRGEYFSWLSSDDICAPNKLEELVNAMEADESIGMVYSAFDIIDDDGKITHEECFDFNALPKSEFFLLFLKGNRINGNTVLIRRELFTKVGLFDEGHRSFKRLWMVTEVVKWIEIVLKSKVYFVKNKLHYARIHKAKNPVYESGLPAELMGMMVEDLLEQYPPERLYKCLDISFEKALSVETSIAQTLVEHKRIACLEKRLAMIKEKSNGRYIEIMENLRKIEHLVSISKLAKLFILKRAGYEELSAYEFDTNALRYLNEHYTYILGSALKKASDLKRAIQVLEHLISRTFIGTNDIRGAAYFHLGEMYYCSGQHNRAEEAFHKCIAIMPTHAKAKEYLQQGQLICQQ